MKKILIAIAVLAMSGSAFAQTCNGDLACSGNPTVGDNRSGQVVGTGQIANGGISSSTGGNANIAAGAVNNTNASVGGSASIAAGAVNSTNTNSVAGGSASIAAGAVNNTNTAAGGTVGNTTSSSGGNTLIGGSNASSVSGVAGVNGGVNTNTNINIGDNAATVIAAEAAARGQIEAARLNANALADQKIRNTPSISPSALTSSNDTCMGSASGSLSAPGIGIALGSTYTDKNCVMLKNSRELWNMGMRGAAMALMCTDAANRDALELTGYICPQTERENGRKIANATAVQPQYTDPIVRARLGLAPLK